MTEERGANKSVAKVCPCEACKKSRKEPNKIKFMSMNSYSSRPAGGWRKQAASNEADARLFMGVELETAVKDGDSLRVTARLNRELPMPIRPSGADRYDARLMDEFYTEETRVYRLRDIRYNELMQIATAGAASAEEAVSMAEPIGWWHPKHDSSVSGPEFASLPGTLAYWYSIKDDLAGMFTSLLHAGVRSHSGDTAGMHISLSIEAFEESEHLIRFARLINNNRTWSRRMSQRTAHSLHWCRIGTDQFSGSDYEIENWARRIMTRGAYGGDRYVALNAPGDGRLEFRLPRGTLRLDRFFKNLEWVAAMVEFTRLYNSTKSAEFMRWVMGQGNYPDLKAFLTEKFGLPVGDYFQPEYAPEIGPDSISLDRSMIANAGPSYDEDEGFYEDDPDEDRCPCDDGCYRMACGNCEEEGINGYPPRPVCDNCGEDHGDYSMDYLPWQAGYDVHNLTDGRVVGPRRIYSPWSGVEAQYDARGRAMPFTTPRVVEQAPVSTAVPPSWITADTVRGAFTLNAFDELATLPESTLCVSGTCPTCDGERRRRVTISETTGSALIAALRLNLPA